MQEPRIAGSILRDLYNKGKQQTHSELLQLELYMCVHTKWMAACRQSLPATLFLAILSIFCIGTFA